MSTVPVTGKLAIDGGDPVRTTPLPWELPGAHWFGQEEIDAVTQVLKAKSPFRFYGIEKQGMTEKFEEAWRARHQRKFALGVNSGTSALHISLCAMGVGPGDEVLVPGYMWVSCLSAVVRTGAIPRLVDIDDTFCVCPAHLEKMINPRTKALLYVNMSGAPGRLPEIVEICKKKGIFLLEDCAQAAGSKLHGKPVGSFGDVSIFSFQLNKNLSAGEGGALVTDDEKLFRRCVAVHDLGFPRTGGRLDTTDPDCALWGVGSRMNELTAAVLLAQNDKLDRITGAMRDAKWQIRKRLEGIAGLEFRTILDPAGDSGPFMITLYPDQEKCARFTAALKAEGMKGPEGSLVCLPLTDFGLHWYFNVPSLVNKTSNSHHGFPWTHPANAFHQEISYALGTLPRCDEYFARGAMLTVASCLTQQDIDDIVTAFQKVAADTLMHILSSILETPLEALVERADQIEVWVIGSGTAGVTTANELAAAGIGPVAILEAGPFVMTQHVGTSPFARRPEIVPAIHDLVRYETSWMTEADHQKGPRKGNNTAWSAVGGRTLFWGGCTPKFDPWDFADWPITFEEFEPYYDRAEDVMSVSGTRHGHPAFCRGHDQDQAIMRLNQAGIPARRAPLGVDTESVVNGRISRGFDSSVDRLLRSGYLVRLDKCEDAQGKICLTPEVVVTKLYAEGDRVVAMDLLDKPTQKTYKVNTKRVVLACGAVQSTRLAMVSGLDGGNGLVGRYLNDHLFVQGLMKLKKPPQDPAFYVLVMPTQNSRFQVQMQGCFRETWYSPYHATVWLDPHKDGTYVLFYCFGSGTVEKDNRLHLYDAEGEYGGMRDYCVIYDRSEEDLRVIEEMKALMPRVAEAIGADIVRTQTNEAGSALHEIGGLRMGTDPATSVTDVWGRFHHLQNLSVADSSTWPYQGPANSYLTITAWSLRHADGLVKRVKAEGQLAGKAWL